MRVANLSLFVLFALDWDSQIILEPCFTISPRSVDRTSRSSNKLSSGLSLFYISLPGFVSRESFFTFPSIFGLSVAASTRMSWLHREQKSLFVFLGSRSLDIPQVRVSQFCSHRQRDGVFHQYVIRIYGKPLDVLTDHVRARNHSLVIIEESLVRSLTCGLTTLTPTELR